MPFHLIRVVADLEAAERRWQQAAIASYSYTFQWICFCPYQRVRITVVDGIVTTVIDTETMDTVEADRYGTVEDLFAFVDDAVAQQAAAVEADYDAVWGYPYTASVDYLRYAIDDEVGLMLTDFEAVPVP